MESAPEDYKLPEELVGQPPRAIPTSVRNSRLAKRIRKTYQITLAAGVICVLLAPLPFVKTLSLYILPLGYLPWIGLGLGLLGAWKYLTESELKKACRYIREGESTFARVNTLVKSPTMIYNGEPTTYAFVAQIELIHPDTGDQCLYDVKSRDFGSEKKDVIDTRFRIGDAIPVVWLPGQFESTLQIYDFLEVSPEADLLRKSETVTKSRWGQTLGLLAAIPVFFFALFWNVYAYGRFDPLDFSYTKQGLWPLGIGGFLGLLGIIYFFLVRIKSRKQLNERNIKAIEAGEAIELEHQQNIFLRIFMGFVLVAGAILLSGLTVLCWCFTANALLDESQPKLVPVQITETIQTTHAFLFRDYSLKYRRAADKKDKSMLTTPQHLTRFNSPAGLARVREGWLGWPWVETIEPVVVVTESPASATTPEGF